MKVEAFKAKSGKLFSTEIEATRDDIAHELNDIFGKLPYPSYGYSLGYICERLVEKRKEIIKLLSSLDNPK